MTNEEVLERLKKCFTNYRFPGGYQELALTNEKELNSLVIDLLKDARREKAEKIENELNRFAMKSTYGKYSYDGFIRVGSGDWKKLYEYSIRDFDTEELKGFAKMFTGVNPSLGKGKNIKSVMIDEFKVDRFKSNPLKQKDNTPKVMFNEPATIFQWGDFKTVVKCDEEDNFSRLIGLGIALYRYYRQHKDHKKQFNVLANGYMDLERLAYYALDYFTKFEKSNFKKLFSLIKHGEEGSWIKLDI